MYFFSPPGKCCEICSLVQFLNVSHIVSFSLWNLVEQCWTQQTVPHSWSTLFRYTFKVLFICSEPNKNLGIWLKKMQKRKTWHDGILPYCSCSPVLAEAACWDPLDLPLFTLDFALYQISSALKAHKKSSHKGRSLWTVWVF